MPYSSVEGKDWTVEKLLQITTQNMNILDVGVGSGTYSDLLRSQMGGYWEGVEVFPRYIEQFKLNDKYDFIHIMDIRNFDWKIKDYDVIFFGDILEHLCKEDAVSIVEKAVIHSKYVIISTNNILVFVINISISPEYSLPLL